LNFNFLLELSLLKQYKLIDHYDYKVEVKRSHFWIPLISDDSVPVSIILRKGKDKNVVDTLPSGRSNKITRDLIVVGREKGTWKIKRFNITDTSIAGIYNNLRQNIKLDKYVKRIPDGFLLKNAKIDTETLSSMDKRLLKFSLHRIQKSLDIPDK
jgi:hypothetical protein